MSESDSFLKELEAQIRARLETAGGSRRTSKRAPFTRFLRQNFEWFEAQHTENAMTWQAWADLMAARGMTNIAGEAISARALRGAYDREKRARARGGRKPPPAPRPETRGQSSPGSARPSEVAATGSGGGPAAEPPAAAPAPEPAPAPARRGFRPAGGEKQGT